MEGGSIVSGWKKLGRGTLRALLPFTFRKSFQEWGRQLLSENGDLGI